MTERTARALGVRCWFEGRGAGPCGGGQLERAHWIRQQVIRRELGGPIRQTCPRCGRGPGERCKGKRKGVHKERGEVVEGLLWDPRVWSFMCHDHHRAMDHARTLRVARAELPPDVEEYARERDAALSAEPLQAWLDMEYGPIESEAA